MKLGKLKEINIRDVWAHEQHDFSKWLASDENIKELGTYTVTVKVYAEVATKLKVVVEGA